MRVLSVRQPWAWAIVHGGKDVENRSRNVAGGYRGPVAIHAALQASEQGMRDDNVRAAWAEHGTGDPLDALVIGAVIGIVNLWAVHPDRDNGLCCPKGGGAWAMRDHWHLCLTNPRPLSTPIPAKGRLGLWHADVELDGRLRDVGLSGKQPGPETNHEAGYGNPQGNCRDAGWCEEQGQTEGAASCRSMSGHKADLRMAPPLSHRAGRRNPQ